tara:strand:+ start:1628 stop:2770 length:1143 start_codon:yes stop_codon:yes gene_type:complete
MHPGNPVCPNYWKNIIPKDYSIFNREGISIGVRENLILNPIMEDLDNDGIADRWEETQYMNPPVSAIYTVLSYPNRSNVQRITDVDGGDQRGKGIQIKKPANFNYQDGKIYRLTFDARASNTIIGFLRTAIFTSATNLGTYEYTTEWKTYTFHFTTTGGIGGSLYSNFISEFGATQGAIVNEDWLIGLYTAEWGISGCAGSYLGVGADGADEYGCDSQGPYISSGEWIEIDNVSLGEVIGDYRIGNDKIDVNSEQGWMGQNEYLNSYYYPVLPKYNKYGNFTPLEFDEEENDISDYPYDNKPFSNDNIATTETYVDNNLIFSFSNSSENVDNNILTDLSGNNNLGFETSDYKPKYDLRTNEPKKIRKMNKIKKTKKDGAF